MREWVRGLVVCSLAVGVLTSVCPDGVKKYVQGAGSVLFLFVILSSLRSLDGFDGRFVLSELFEKSESYVSTEAVMEIRESVLEDHVRACLASLGADCEVELIIEERDDELVCSKCFIRVFDLVSMSKSDDILSIVSKQTGISEENIEIEFSETERRDGIE